MPTPAMSRRSIYAARITARGAREDAAETVTLANKAAGSADWR